MGNIGGGRPDGDETGEEREKIDERKNNNKTVLFEIAFELVKVRSEGGSKSHRNLLFVLYIVTWNDKKRYSKGMIVLASMRTWFVRYGFILLGVLLLNVGIINWYLVSKRQTETNTNTREVIEGEVGCDRECVGRIVETRLKTQEVSPAQVIEKTVTPTPTPTVTPIKTVVKAPTPTPISRTEYVSLPAGTMDSTLDWVSMASSKWLDTSLYGELVSASWEGWLEMPGGSGTAYVRLFDATNGRAVDGSERTMTNTVRTSFYSGNVSIWRGQNQYFIQVKSSGGGTVKVDGARIKLVVR